MCVWGGAIYSVLKCLSIESHGADTPRLKLSIELSLSKQTVTARARNTWQQGDLDPGADTARGVTPRQINGLIMTDQKKAVEGQTQ